MADKKKKKGMKMSLVDFLADASGGSSWAAEGSGHDDFVLPSAHFSKLPKSPPFTAYLGNLPFDTETFNIEEGLKDCKIVNINLAKDKNDGRFRGFAYVEFAELDSLKRALDLNGILCLQGRKIRFDIAEPPKSGTGMMGATRSTMRPGSAFRADSGREGPESGYPLDLGAWRRAAPLPREPSLEASRKTRGDGSGNGPRPEYSADNSFSRSFLASSKSTAATAAPSWRSSHEQMEEPTSSASMHSSASSISLRPFSASRSMDMSRERERPNKPHGLSDAERTMSWRK